MEILWEDGTVAGEFEDELEKLIDAACDMWTLKIMMFIKHRKPIFEKVLGHNKEQELKCKEYM